MYHLSGETWILLCLSQETFDVVFSNRGETSGGMGGYLYSYEREMDHLSLCGLYRISDVRMVCVSSEIMRKHGSSHISYLSNDL